MQRLLALVVLLVAVASLSLSSRAQQSDFVVLTSDTNRPIVLYRASHALVVGIDKYGDGWAPLHLAVADAVAVANELEKQGFSVTLKVDKDVKLANGKTIRASVLDHDGLQRSFRDFIFGPGRNPDARLVIWFAGHGHTLNRIGYIVPHKSPNPSSAPVDLKAEAEADFESTAISLEAIGVMLRQVRARHVLAIFDSCFSGTIFRNRGDAPTGYEVNESAANPVRHLIASGDALQTVADDGKFRELFIDALRGKGGSDGRTADENRDGLVTGTELGRYLTRMITNYSPSRQTPQSGKINDRNFDEGEFVFRTAGTKPPAQSAQVASVGTTPPKLSEVAEAWLVTQNTNQVEMLEVFRDKYPDTIYAQLAQARITVILKGVGVPKSKGFEVVPSEETPLFAIFSAGTDQISREGEGTSFASVVAQSFEEGKSLIATGNKILDKVRRSTNSLQTPMLFFTRNETFTLATHTGPKYALVIGNAVYKDPNWALRHPVTDARSMADFLVRQGFSVLTVLNGTRMDIAKAVSRLSASLQTAKEAVGFVYYSGHGAEIAGSNYLVPVDASDVGVEHLYPVSDMFSSLTRRSAKFVITVFDTPVGMPISFGR